MATQPGLQMIQISKPKIPAVIIGTAEEYKDLIVIIGWGKKPIVFQPSLDKDRQRLVGYVNFLLLAGMK